MDGLYNRFLDTNMLKSLQDGFCQSVGVYAYCVDSIGMKITKMSGREQDVEKLQHIVTGEQRNALFEHLAGSSLEDQATCDTDIACIKYAAVCVKEDGKPLITWILCGVMDTCDTQQDEEIAGQFAYRISEERFADALDLLREASGYMLSYQKSAKKNLVSNGYAEYSKEKMENILLRTAATTEIVQLLDNDDPIEEVLQKIMRIAGTFLKIDYACVCNTVTEDSNTMDVIAQWCNEGIVSAFDQTRKQPRPSFLYGKKPLVLSEPGSREDHEKDMKKAGAKALVAFPIVLKERITMYACFEAKKRTRIWEVDEIKFLKDSVKVMESMLTKRIQKNSLASSYAALEEVLDNVGSSIYVRDRQSGNLLFVNRNLRRFFREEMAQNTLASIFESQIPADSTIGNVEVCMEKDGSWYDLFYKEITWVDGRCVLMCSIYDVTEKKTYQQKIERQAYTDFLTGLYNRMCCERDLAKYVDTAQKTNGNGAVLYMDLDDFKHINDSLGHQYGDVLLKSIAHGMQGVPGIQNSCYRMGGDEFVIIIPPNQYKNFEQIVDGVKTVFSKPWFLKDADYYCTMSMGIVHFPQEGERVQELIKKADIAMYEAKKSGKNRVATYNNNIKSDSNKRLDMEKNMRDAAIDGCKEFEVFYQPIIDIQLNDTCVGAEALIRWNSEELGFMSPVDFIPLAEYLGLINPIGNHVLLEACKECKKWNDNGHPGYKINVNLSVVQLLQPDIVDIIKDTLEKTGLTPHNLTLEVTEGLAINDLDRMKRILAQIKELGVRIALDDFGTGYSSLSHIRELPFDVIKVDQSFVKDLAEDMYSKSFIRMVSDLADAIGVSICVEGIETREQYDVLGGMKVGMVQGYYFDKPMPKAQFEDKYL